MKRISKILAIFILAVSLSGAPQYAYAASLDGQVFTGKVYNLQDRENPVEEYFIFDKGLFRPVESGNYGFEPAKYTQTSSKNQTQFKAVTKNKAGDSITWSGTVTGEMITGTALRKTHDGKEFKLTFTGEKAKA